MLVYLREAVVQAGGLERMTLADLRAGIRALATALEVPDAGERLVDEVDAGLAAVRARVSGEAKPRVLLVVGHRPLIVAGGGTVRVAHDGRWRATIDASGTGWYFKVGSYVQSNASRGDERGAVGEVVVHGLRVTHSDR